MTQESHDHNVELTLPTPASLEEEDYDEEGEEDYEDAPDIDAEAEEMARRLGDQLWADIAKAQLEAAAAAASSAATVPSAPITFKGKQEAALATIKQLLTFASSHPVVHAAFTASLISVPEATNVLAVFERCASSGPAFISKSVASTLSGNIAALSKSENLFTQTNNQSSDLGKRKRDDLNGISGPHGYNLINNEGERAQKKVAVAIDEPGLSYQVMEALRAITSVLSSAPPPSSSTPHMPTHPNPTPSVDPALISSIQFQLHQVFLFAVTSSARPAPQSGDLHELSGLIQMLGVLSGVPIGPPHPQHASAQALVPDIGTAVYPCLVASCTKTFHRLFSLRAHQRLHTLVDRPYRCVACPASFARNHDLKRHAKLHERRAWRCTGCGKIFSRRDAIKRHKDNRRAGRAGGESAAECADADVEEVEVEKASSEEDPGRWARLWSGIAASQNQALSGLAADESNGGGLEEGEVSPGVIEHLQSAALDLKGLLQTYVACGLGTNANPPAPFPPQPGPTLASVIASAQVHLAPPAPAPPTASQAADVSQSSAAPSSASAPAQTTSLAWPGLSEEQTKLLEQAIAQAASAARAQAEAEAEAEEEEYGGDEEGFDEEEGDA